MLKKSIKGIGLLELMLSLAIIAVLLIMATRYYSSASASQKIQAAVDQINATRSAVQNAAAGISTSSSSATIGDLVAAGYLPLSFVAGVSNASAAAGMSSGVTPWGGSISIGNFSTKTFDITMDTPNSQTCTAVQNKINATAAQGSAASCSDSTLTVTYAL